MNADESCTSRSPLTPLRSGLHSRCAKPFPGTRHRVTCCAIKIGSLAVTSPTKSRRWHQTSPIGTSISVAARLCGTADRHHPPRMPGSHVCLQRARPVSAHQRISGPLSSQSPALVFAEGQSGTAVGATAEVGPDCLDSSARWAASSLRTSCRLSGSLIPTQRLLTQAVSLLCRARD
jgi:hypothetical protein